MSQARKPVKLDRSEYKRSAFFVAAPPGMKLEDVLDADFWEHVRNQINIFDTLEVVAIDGAFDVLIRLVSKTPVSMKFRILRESDPDGVVARNTGPIPFKVAKNNSDTWGVQNTKTGQFLEEGLTKADAEKRFKEMQKEAGVA